MCCGRARATATIWTAIYPYGLMRQDISFVDDLYHDLVFNLLGILASVREKIFECFQLQTARKRDRDRQCACKVCFWMMVYIFVHTLLQVNHCCAGAIFTWLTMHAQLGIPLDQQAQNDPDHTTRPCVRAVRVAQVKYHPLRPATAAAVAHVPM